MGFSSDPILTLGEIILEFNTVMQSVHLRTCTVRNDHEGKDCDDYNFLIGLHVLI